MNSGGGTQSQTNRFPGMIRAVLLASWLIGFSYWFFQQRLPNSGGFTRPDVWYQLLDDLPTLGFGADDGLPSATTKQLLNQRGPLILAAAAILLSALSMGLAIVVWLLPRGWLSRSECLVVAMGAGLSLQSLWTLIIGRMGWLTSGSVMLPLAVGAIAVTFWWFQNRSADLPTTPSEFRFPRDQRLPKGMVLACSVVFALFFWNMFTGAMTPPTDFDVREYHLQGPREYFESGQISFLEHNVYTSFPFLTEMLSLDGMVLLRDHVRGALAGKLVLMMFLPLSTLAVWCIGRRWGGRAVGLLGAFVYATTPWTYRIAIIAYAEGALSFYTVATVMVLLLAMKKSDWRLNCLLGLLAGSAMASKYTGAVSVCIPAGVVLVLRQLMTSFELKARLKRACLTGLVFSVGVLIAVGPWLAKNAMDTGNPVYPLAYSVFGARDWNPELNERWTSNHGPNEHELTRIPMHIADAFLLNDWGSSLLLGLWVPGLLLLRRHRSAAFVSLFAVINLFLWWALTHRIDRFWVPVIPLVSVAGGFAWMASGSTVWRGTIVCACAVATLFNLEYCNLSVLSGFNAGLADLEVAREKTVPPDIARLNQILPDDAKVLCVGEAQVFDADFDLIYNTVFDDSLFEQLTSTEPHTTEAAALKAEMESADAIRRRFEQHKLTHVFVNWAEVLRYRRTYGYAEFVQPSRFERLQTMGILDVPQTLLSRDWDSMSDPDREEIRSWQDWESLIDDRGQFCRTQVFRILRP